MMVHSRQPGSEVEEEDRSQRMREAATEVVQRLQGAGHTAYFAGGCVRDRLMGNQPDDYDIATSARPEQVDGLFRHVQYVGESFGVMLVRNRGFTIEVATFRTDGVYRDGRHPDSVVFSDEVHDAQRRDFTINGLFEDPLTGKVIDHVGGVEDIRAGIVRAIGEPADRFGEDHLRMLRAVRFAARFGYALGPETAEAIREFGSNLSGVSRERIGEEVRLMLTDRNRGVAGWEMQYLGLDATVLQEGHSMAAPTRLGRLQEDAAYPTALAAWLLDRTESDGEQADLQSRAEQWGRSLMLSNREWTSLREILYLHAVLLDQWDRLGVARQKRLIVSPGFNEALRLILTVDKPRFVEIQRQVYALSETGLQPEPLLSGKDLIDLGMRPGPKFRQILDAVYDGQLEGWLATRDQAEQLARAMYQAEQA